VVAFEIKIGETSFFKKKLQEKNCRKKFQRKTSDMKFKRILSSSISHSHTEVCPRWEGII
jgi:hypothetical protein